MPNQQRKAEPKLIYKTLLVFRMPAFENRKIFRRTGVRTALFSRLLKNWGKGRRVCLRGGLGFLECGSLPSGQA